MAPAHGQGVDERGVVVRDVRPDSWILQIESACACGLATRFGERERARAYVVTDAVGSKPAGRPHGHALFLEPCGRLDQDRRDDCDILRACATDVHHESSGRPMLTRSSTA